jgi:hypothetical protein
MPDDDYLIARLPRRWRPVARAVANGDDIQVLTDRVVRALAATLPDIGGIPPINEVADQAHEIAKRQEGELDLGLGYRSLLRPSDTRPQIDIMWNRARALLESRTHQMAEDRDSARLTLAVEAVKALGNHFGFSRVAPALLADPNRDDRDISDRWTRALEHPSIEQLARGLLRHPDGTGLRAPRRTRRSIAQLLETPLEKL